MTNKSQFEGGGDRYAGAYAMMTKDVRAKELNQGGDDKYESLMRVAELHSIERMRSYNVTQYSAQGGDDKYAGGCLNESLTVFCNFPLR